MRPKLVKLVMLCISLLYRLIDLELPTNLRASPITRDSNLDKLNLERRARNPSGGQYMSPRERLDRAIAATNLKPQD